MTQAMERKHSAMMRAILDMEQKGLTEQAQEFKERLAYEILGVSTTDGHLPDTTALAYQFLGTTLRRVPTETPGQFKKTRNIRGGGTAAYVEVGYVKQVLNTTFGPFWDFTRVGDPSYLMDEQYMTDGRAGLIIVRGRLTIHIPTPLGWQSIIKEAVGEAEIQRFAKEDRNGKPLPNGGKPVNIGDDEKAAESDALKRAASYLGIAADVYWGKDEIQQYEEVNR